MITFRLNALCDYKAFEDTSRMRREMLYAVKLDISSGRVSDVTELYGYILESYASIGVVSLRAEERTLLSGLLWRKRHMVRDMGLAGGSRRGDESLALSEDAVSVKPPRRDAGRYYKNKKNRDYRINSFAGRVNLNIYSLGFDKVDYFSLVLYLWEDNPFDRNRNTACSSRLNAIFISLISLNLQNHLSRKKPKGSFNQNNKSGKQSVVFHCFLLDYPHNRYLLHDSFVGLERVLPAVVESGRFRVVRSSW
jgi:hypothetical protein